MTTESLYDVNHTIHKLGQHRTLCGDSFDPQAVDALIQHTNKAQLVLTDPPYAIYGSSTGVGSDIADDRMIRPFFEALARTIHHILDDDGAAYIHTDWRSWSALTEGCRRAQLAVKNCIVWDKQRKGLGVNYMNQHEFIAYCIKTKPQTITKKTQHKRKISDSNVMQYPRPRADDKQHNAAKPIPLLERLITNTTNENDLVIDLFGGSGSTLIACENTNRRCGLIEIEPRWIEHIAQRYALHTKANSFFPKTL
jgi:DNA modification methylase